MKVDSAPPNAGVKCVAALFYKHLTPNGVKTSIDYRMQMSLLDCLNLHNIWSLAGERWFARGETYLQQGRIQDLNSDGYRLTANVTGTQTYSVRLSCRSSRIEYSCTCPVGEDGNFCKHCVAVALAWLEEASTIRDPNISTAKHKPDLRSFLEAQDHQKLVELMLQEASRNRGLEERLEFEAARAKYKAQRDFFELLDGIKELEKQIEADDS